MEFDREIVHDSSDVYHDNRDPEFFRKLDIDTSITAQTDLAIFGQTLQITTWPKSKASAMSLDRMLLLIWFLTFVVFSLVVTWQIHRQKNLLADIRHANALLKSNKKRIMDQNVQMLRLNVTKDRFFSIIAHDLRGPLASIKGLMDKGVAKKIENPEVRDIFSKLRQSTSATLELLDNLLRWAIAQTGDIPYKPFPVNLYNIIADTVNILNQSAREKQLTLKFNVDDDLFSVGDRNMLTTVFRNLISNSIKYTKPGGTIDVDAKVEGDQIRISVTDTGMGIEPDKIPGLFDLNTRISENDSNKLSSTGLGLILCKDFIDKHKGTISVESTIGVGSTFIVVLPKHNLADAKQ